MGGRSGRRTRRMFSVIAWQHLVRVAEMVLAELAGNIALRLEQAGNGRVFYFHALFGRADLRGRADDGTRAGAVRGPVPNSVTQIGIAAASPPVLGSKVSESVVVGLIGLVGEVFEMLVDQIAEYQVKTVDFRGGSRRCGGGRDRLCDIWSDCQAGDRRTNRGTLDRQAQSEGTFRPGCRNGGTHDRGGWQPFRTIFHLRFGGQEASRKEARP